MLHFMGKWCPKWQTIDYLLLKSMNNNFYSSGSIVLDILSCFCQVFINSYVDKGSIFQHGKQTECGHLLRPSITIVHLLCCLSVELFAFPWEHTLKNDFIIKELPLFKHFLKRRNNNNFLEKSLNQMNYQNQKCSSHSYSHTCLIGDISNSSKGRIVMLEKRNARHLIQNS